MENPKQEVKGWWTKKKVKRIILTLMSLGLLATYTGLLFPDLPDEPTIYQYTEIKIKWTVTMLASAAWLVIWLIHLGVGDIVGKSLDKIDDWWSNLPENGKHD